MELTILQALSLEVQYDSFNAFCEKRELRGVNRVSEYFMTERCERPEGSVKHSTM
jgi:hypothetical protein